MSALDKCIRYGLVSVRESKEAVAELARLRRIEAVLKWIADNDPKGEGDAYWYSEQCGVRAVAALEEEGRDEEV